jgi:hypothetical protein
MTSRLASWDLGTTSSLGCNVMQYIILGF